MELGTDKKVAEIISRLKLTKPGEGVVNVEGTWGSFARLLGAYISEKTSRPILYICPHIDDADKAADDLHTFGGERIDTFGAWEGEEDLADATDEIRAERLKTVSRVSCIEDSSDNSAFIIAAPIQALCQPVPKPEAIEASCLRLKVEGETSPEKVVVWLVENGFERVERLDLPGQFARRGGIVDIYAPLMSKEALSDNEQDGSSEDAEAVRVEFFGDTI